MNTADLLTALQEIAAQKPVEVRAAGKTFYVRPLTVEQVEEQLADDKKTKGTEEEKHAIVRGAIRVLCDENGARLLDPRNDAHVAAIAQLPWVALRKITDAADVKDEDEGKEGN